LRMSPLTPYLLAAMLSWLPSKWLDTHPPCERARLESIAESNAVVAAEWPVFQGQDGPVLTALLMVAIERDESGGYREDVDAFKTSGRGDHGVAWGLLQVHLESWDRCRDREDCLRRGREAIRESLRWCVGLPQLEQLAGFTGGSCGSEPARAASRRRYGRAQRWWAEHPYLLGVD
jgi:hypothetical protein